MTLEHPFCFSSTVVTYGNEWNSLRSWQICGSVVLFVIWPSNLTLFWNCHSHVNLLCTTEHCFKRIVVHLLSHIWLFATPWTGALPTFLSFTISQSLLNKKLLFTKIHTWFRFPPFSLNVLDPFPGSPPGYNITSNCHDSLGPSWPWFSQIFLVFSFFFFLIYFGYIIWLVGF